MKTKRGMVGRVAGEFEGAALGDERLEGRLVAMASRLAARPDRSIPRAMVTSRETEAAYRFMSNEAVDFEAILGPHVEATAERAKGASWMVAIHDTSAMPTPGLEPEEIGYLNTGKAGFYAHVSLLTELQGGVPLGVVNLRLFTRRQAPSSTPKPGTRSTRKKRSGWDTRRNPTRESLRWGESIEATAQTLGELEKRTIHVMDREADMYELLKQLIDGGHRFVIRMARDRRARSHGECEEAVSKVRNIMQAQPTVLERDVELSRRIGTSVRSARHPNREARTTTLHVAAARVELQPPAYAKGSGTVDVNVVQVREATVHATSPVEWVLFTSEPTETRDDVARVVDVYRRRWLIEELFKALKTGCGYDDRMLESPDAMYRMLALSLPIAWHLLFLRELQRAHIKVPASQLLSPIQKKILEHLHPAKLSNEPTASDVLLLIASMGGHLKHNGPPGWQTLFAGMQYLLGLEEGVKLAGKM